MTNEQFVKNVESVVMGVLKREESIDGKSPEKFVIEFPFLPLKVDSKSDDEPVLGYGIPDRTIPKDGHKLIKMIAEEEDKK